MAMFQAAKTKLGASPWPALFSDSSDGPQDSRKSIHPTGRKDDRYRHLTDIRRVDYQKSLKNAILTIC
jgi:hypothetical protein